MMFRRLYWVIDRLTESGPSTIVGVFTSIPDLIEKGLSNAGHPFRLTLVQLDDGPLGTFLSPSFDGLEESLNRIVESHEISAEEKSSLLERLRAIA